MLFEVDIEPVYVMTICLGGCTVIGHLALYAGQGGPMVTTKPMAYAEVDDKDNN